MGARTQPTPGYYVWEVAGKPVVVHLHLGVVDRLAAEITLGEAARKRGAEVGGVLIGTIERGDPSVVRIDDFETVDDHDEGAGFEDACAHWRPDETRPTYAVGYFRSRAGEGFSLAPRDIELLAKFFPSPWHVALLVKRSPERVAAGFFFREDGAFQQSTPLEFPLGRRELTREEPPPRERRRSGRDTRTIVPDVVAQEDDRGSSLARSRRPVRGGHVWIPLAFIFLLLGVLVGFQAALTMAPKISDNATKDFSLGLSVSKAAENLSVHWDRQALAVRTAPRGVLEIEDGSYKKSVELDTAQLQNGALLYRNSSNAVKFRLVVYPREGVSVTQTADWRP
jgi:hypothetical protein